MPPKAFSTTMEADTLKALNRYAVGLDIAVRRKGESSYG